MITGVEGKPGRGKTLLTTDLAFERLAASQVVLANYRLKFPFEYIECVEDVLEISKRFPEGTRFCILLDEIWVTADARRSSNNINLLLSQHVLQSRKVNADIFYTTQVIRQLDPRITDITDFVLRPNIKIRYAGRPYIMKVKVFERSYHGGHRMSHSFFRNVYQACDLYDTSEIIRPLASRSHERILEKYLDYSGSVKELEALIRFDNPGTSKAEASSLASYVRAKQRVDGGG